METDAVVRYLAFDIESVADGRLVSEIQYPGKHLGPKDAIDRFRKERMEATGSDFIPYTFQFPVSIAVAKIRGDTMSVKVRNDTNLAVTGTRIVIRAK